MNQFEEKLMTYKEEADQLGFNLSDALLENVAKSLGPAIYLADAATVAISDKQEMATVKKNFLIKKLGLEDGSHLDEAIAQVAAEMGVSNRNKHRVIFYALLVKKFKKEYMFQ
ncbi:MAG: DUF2853 family protein [Saprospiraceae bacterium]|nr:DUF2853 family protein [Saprospiraceae bacterium]